MVVVTARCEYKDKDLLVVTMVVVTARCEYKDKDLLVVTMVVGSHGAV